MSLSTHHLLNRYVARRLKYPRDLGLEQKAVGDANDDDRNGPRTSPLISVDNGGRTRSLGPLRRETSLVREPAAPRSYGICCAANSPPVSQRRGARPGGE